MICCRDPTGNAGGKVFTINAGILGLAALFTAKPLDILLKHPIKGAAF